MINPLRSEAEAFRFVIGAIVYFAAIAIASAAGGWKAGLPGVLLLPAAPGVGGGRTRRTQRRLEGGSAGVPPPLGSPGRVVGANAQDRAAAVDDAAPAP